MSDDQKYEIDQLIDERLSLRIGSIVSQFSRWMVLFLLGGAGTVFVAGMWANAMIGKIENIGSDLSSLIHERRDTLAEWNAWRARIDSQHNDKFTGSDYESLVQIYNQQMPATRLPSLYQVKKGHP